MAHVQRHGLYSHVSSKKNNTFPSVFVKYYSLRNTIPEDYGLNYSADARIRFTTGAYTRDYMPVKVQCQK